MERNSHCWDTRNWALLIVGSAAAIACDRWTRRWFAAEVTRRFAALLKQPSPGPAYWFAMPVLSLACDLLLTLALPVYLILKARKTPLLWGVAPGVIVTVNGLLTPAAPLAHVLRSAGFYLTLL